MCICVHHIYLFAATAALLAIWMLYPSSPIGSTCVLLLLPWERCCWQGLLPFLFCETPFNEHPGGCPVW